MAAASVTRTSSRARLRSGVTALMGEPPVRRSHEHPKTVQAPRVRTIDGLLRLDWEIAKRGFRRYAAYPAATWAGVFTNTVFGFMQAYVLLAVYRHRTDVGGYDAGDTVTYVW